MHITTTKPPSRGHDLSPAHDQAAAAAPSARRRAPALLTAAIAVATVAIVAAFVLVLMDQLAAMRFDTWPVIGS